MLTEFSFLGELTL